MNTREGGIRMCSSSVTKATLGRIPQYLKFLKELPTDNFKYVSATYIAKELGLGEVQVRKDLNAISGAGKPKLGYVTEELISKLEDSLGYNCITPAVLVGAGKLGKALLDYDGFEKFGVKIVQQWNCEIIRVLLMVQEIRQKQCFVK